MAQMLLSVEEAARRMGGVSKWSIYSWMSQGRLRKTKIGSRVMIGEHDLQVFIDQCNPESSVTKTAASSHIDEPA